MPEAASPREDRIARLRWQVDALSRGREAERPGLPFGVPALDAHLPARGLRRGALHEVGEAGASAEYAALAALFAAAVLGRLLGPVLWCLRYRDLFAPALVTVGLCPSRVLFAETGSDRHVLPAMEEGLHTRGLCAVVGEVGRLGLIASRRLQLGAERTGVLVIAIRRPRTAAERDKAADEPGAALTRWRVSPQPGIGPPRPGLPRARWHVELVRARGADAPRSWLLDAPDATGRLALPADMADRPVAAALPLPRARLG